MYLVLGYTVRSSSWAVSLLKGVRLYEADRLSCAIVHARKQKDVGRFNDVKEDESRPFGSTAIVGTTLLSISQVGRERGKRMTMDLANQPRNTFHGWPF